MGERCPTEQVWGIATANTAAFPLPPGGPAPKGNWMQYWLFRTYKMQVVLFTFQPLAQNGSSINEKQPLLFSNFFCPCFILPGDGGHAVMRLWHTTGVVVTFENFWLCSPDTWHHCPSSCILSSMTKPGWSGKGLQLEILVKSRKKNWKWSLLHQKHLGFLFQMRQLSRHSQLLLQLQCVIEEPLMMVPLYLY